jgi:hypothetical protein
MQFVLKQATTTLHNNEVALVLVHARALPLLISSNGALVRRLLINQGEGSVGRLLATMHTKGVGMTTGEDHPKEGEATRGVVEPQSASWAMDTATVTGEEGKADR